MKASLPILLPVAACLLGACESPRTDPGDRIPIDPPPGVIYMVGIGAAVPGIEVTVDGARLEPRGGAYALSLGYEDVAEAAAAPLFHLETSKDGVAIDAIDIGFGACLELCADIGGPCDLTLERVSATFDADGVFEGWAPHPRAWRGLDCLYCTGVGVVCT